MSALTNYLSEREHRAEAAGRGHRAAQGTGVGRPNAMHHLPREAK
jgi:hypothetical protein